MLERMWCSLGYLMNLTLLFAQFLVCTVDENFDVIMKELLKEMGSRLWRNRESGCKAVSDLLQVS